MQRWEYKMQELRLEDASLRTATLKHLNKLGEDGWELVAVHNGYAYLKRPQQHQEVL